MKLSKRTIKESQDGQVTEATSYGPPAAGSVKSAGRVLRILEFFDEIQREARVAEIAERLSIPILYVDSPELSGGPRLYGLLAGEPELPSVAAGDSVGHVAGQWAGKKRQPDQDAGENLAQDRRYRHRRRAQRDFSQYIHVLQARSAMRFHVPHGTRRLVVWSATGFALLTKCTDNEIRALCTRTNAEAPSGQSRVEINQVLENVRRTRRDGYFFSTGLVTHGAGSIAVPLPDGIDGRDRAFTVAVSGILGDIARREKYIVALLHDVAQRYLTEPSTI